MRLKSYQSCPVWHSVRRRLSVLLLRIGTRLSTCRRPAVDHRVRYRFADVNFPGFLWTDRRTGLLLRLWVAFRGRGERLGQQVCVGRARPVFLDGVGGLLLGLFWLLVGLARDHPHQGIGSSAILSGAPASRFGRARSPDCPPLARRRPSSPSTVVCPAA